MFRFAGSDAFLVGYVGVQGGYINGAVSGVPSECCGILYLVDKVRSPDGLQCFNYYRDQKNF